MRRIYQGLAKRRAFFVTRTKTAITEIDNREVVIGLVGFATFFFGFWAGALLNLYLLAIDHPLVLEFRSSLSYKSAILGDGILLPIINMVAIAFILKHGEYIGRKLLEFALVIGMGITVWFHVNQAMQGLVNWAMPSPWQWNILGLWHAIYMFSVISLLSLFYLVSIKIMKQEKDIPIQAFVVSLGIALFFLLLRLDYVAIDPASLIPF